MGENRSWVAPLAFLVFGGVFIGATFSFLQVENLLVGERGTALVAWLTLIMTSCGFAAALTALFIALKQLGETQFQKNVAEHNVIAKRIHTLMGLSYSIDGFHTMAIQITADLRSREEDGEVFAKPRSNHLDQLASFRKEIDKALSSDFYGDIEIDLDTAISINNAMARLVLCANMDPFDYYNEGKKKLPSEIIKYANEYSVCINPIKNQVRNRYRTLMKEQRKLTKKHLR